MEILIAVLIIVVVWLGIDVRNLRKQVKMWVETCRDLKERADVMGDNQYNKFNNAFDRILQIEADNKKIWGTVKLLTGDKPVKKEVKKVTSKTHEFKRGQWIISVWDKDSGGQTDFTKFVSRINEQEFNCDPFYRFTKKSIEILTNSDRGSEYLDIRKSIQWRAATKAEIERFTKLIAKKK